MFEFYFPWIWCLLPLPLIIYYILPPIKQEIGLYLPYLPVIVANKQSKRYFQWIILFFMWVLLLAAVARPISYGAPVQTHPERRDIMLVVDLSGSMQIKDMLLPNNQYIARLTAVKNIVGEFISERKGDRMGLTVFADHAYLQTPLTSDLSTVKQQLQRAVIGLIGQETAIGEGIGIAVKNFIDTNATQRIIILLTDGRNNRGVISPTQALEFAKSAHTKIYTIGIGAEQIKESDIFGRTQMINPSDIDEALLIKIANQTNGRYFRARDAKGLRDIYTEIQKLEPIKDQTEIWRPRFDYFYYPLGLVFILSCLLFIRRYYD